MKIWNEIKGYDSFPELLREVLLLVKLKGSTQNIICQASYNPYFSSSGWIFTSLPLKEPNAIIQPVCDEIIAWSPIIEFKK